MWRLLALVAGCAANVVELRQSDFTTGTYRITEPGTYRLVEDINFMPNNNGPTAYESCWPSASQLGTTYPADTYALGFFAAITIETSDVILDLNNHVLEQSAEHALLQRFFILIELSNSPFLTGQGPHTFTREYIPATRVTVRNGRLGRSSHHSIHGNLNVDVTLEHLRMEGFEVVGVALNGVERLIMRHCELTNRKDVPVLGSFSAARFLQRYIDWLVSAGSSTTLNVRGTALSAADVRTALRNAINNVYADVMATGSINKAAHPVEYALFANVAGLIDGNAYGVLLNKAGVAVNGFPSRPKPPFSEGPSKNVELIDVNVYHHQSSIREVVALVKAGSVVSDSVGAILQLLNQHSDSGAYVTLDPSGAYYTGNPVADAQLFVGKAILTGELASSGLDTSRNGVTSDVVAWAEAHTDGSLTALAADESWQCNGDSMAHVQKGAIGFKIDGTNNARLTDCSVNGLTNFGPAGSSACGAYKFSHPAATLPGYNGAHARGFTFAGSKHITVRSSYAAGVKSTHGNAIGFDIFTDSTNVDLTDCSASLVTADAHNATGFHLGGSTSFSDLRRWCATLITAPHGTALQVWDENGVKNDVHAENCN